MVVQFIKEFRDAHIGDKRNVAKDIARGWIDRGICKALHGPQKNKALTEPVKQKAEAIG